MRTVKLFVLLTSILVYISFAQVSNNYLLIHSENSEPWTCQRTTLSSLALKYPSSSVSISKPGLKVSDTIQPEKPMKILIWNTFWKTESAWEMIFGQITNAQCPASLNGNNCIFTMNRSEVDTSDAILFHLIDIHRNNFHLPPSSFKVSKNQIWIAMAYDPPFMLNFFGLRNASRLNSVFNRTMSYRSDGDILVRHGRFFKLNQSTIIFPSHQHNYAAGKSKLIAWFSSSHGCKSPSRREVYVSELQRYIDVDIYGKCGPLKCGEIKSINRPYKLETDECYSLINTTYKFVIGFENSICTDYVTEKLYNHLRLNVIPIVFGGVDYLTLTPPHSIINAKDFSPKDLAKYLHLLNNNDTLYNEYFDWKKDYIVEGDDGGVPPPCDLCIKMNNQTWRNEIKIYDNFDSWIRGNCSRGYRGEVKPKRN